MSKTSKFFQVLLLAAVLTACVAPADIPRNYLRNPSEMGAMANGCWMYINPGSGFPEMDQNKISGELITVQNDTFYVMTQKSLALVPVKDIKTATLFLFRDQTGYYTLATGLGLLPNIAGALIHSEPAFLAIGIPFALVGILTAVIENSAYQLRFPKKNKLDEFAKFSRFPQGIPSGVKLEELTLMKMDQ